MSKTPEELAEEWSECEWPEVSFLAGYRAAREKCEAEIKELTANFTFCCEDKARLLQELAATGASPWVSVKDLLPEYGLGVFISLPGKGEILTATRCEQYEVGQEGYGWYYLGGRVKSELVSHWMPMPPLPPEENKS